MKAELLDDPCNAAGTDGKARLPEFLGDDLSGGVGVEKTVTDDLALDFIGPNVVGLGPAFLSLKSQRTLLLKEIEHLIITLPGQAVPLSRGGGTEFAFSLNKHEQTWGDLVDCWHDELAARADDPMVRQIECHGRFLQPRGAWYRRGGARARVGR